MSAITQILLAERVAAPPPTPPPSGSAPIEWSYSPETTQTIVKDTDGDLITAGTATFQILQAYTQFFTDDQGNGWFEITSNHSFNVLITFPPGTPEAFAYSVNRTAYAENPFEINQYGDGSFELANADNWITWRDNGNPFKLKVEFEGSTITVYVNDSESWTGTVANMVYPIRACLRFWNTVGATDGVTYTGGTVSSDEGPPVVNAFPSAMLLGSF